MKFLVVFFGIASQIILNTELLTISHPDWIQILVKILQSTGLLTVITEYQQNFIMLFWLQFPLVIPYALICSILVSKLGHRRLYIYSFVSTFVFLFFIIDKLPIFESLLQPLGGLKYFQVFTNVFTFFFFFFAFNSVVKNITRRLTRVSLRDTLGQ